MEADSSASRRALVFAFGMGISATAVALWLRPLLPVDETRYLSVAWEMWWRNEFLVPVLNGEPYSDKPPLVFWVIHFVWWLVGVGETSARLVPPLFMLGSLALANLLARLLWPDRPAVSGLPPVALIGMPVFVLFGSLVMFDLPLTFFVLLGHVAVLKAARRPGPGWWVLVGLALAGGILTKGPVALLHLLPAPLLAPLWMPQPPKGAWRRWYAGLGIAVLGGIALALAWALPAAQAGGEAYASAILWSQTAGRVTHAFAHARPWWFYPALLPVILYPWGWTPGLWRGLSSAAFREPGTRYCLAWMVPSFLILMAISGKQLHYVLPLMPAFALLAGRLLASRKPGTGAIDLMTPAVVPIALGALTIMFVNAPLMFLDLLPRREIPSWAVEIPAYWGGVLIVGAILLSFTVGRRGGFDVLGTAAGGLLIFVTAHAIAHASAFDIYDLRRVSSYLGSHSEAGIAYNKDYEGEFGFLGRLKRRISVVYENDMPGWISRHPGGQVVLRYKQPPGFVPGAPVIEQQYRGHRIGIWVVPEKRGNMNVGSENADASAVH